MEEILFGLSGSIGNVFLGVLLFIIAFLLFRTLFSFLKNWWLDESQKKFAAKINYILLEVRFPKNNEIFPKAMEQVFASFYQIYSFGITVEKKWLEGQFEEIISTEIAASKDGIKFFIKVNKKNRTLVETAIFSQYPGAEIVEAENDYINELPPDIPNDEYNIMGADMILGKNSAYPIRTYPYFFGERKYEEEEVDPIASLTEVMSNLKNDEHLWMQVLIIPAGDALKEEAKKLIAEKMGKKEEPKKGAGKALFEFAVQAVKAPIKPPEWSDAVKLEDKPKSLTAQDNEIIRAVSDKASKLAFYSIARILYIDKKETFSGSNFTAAISTFQQFNTQNLNSTRPAKITMTIPSRFFVPNKKQILLRKKKEIYGNYRNRIFSPYTNVELMYRKSLKPSIMNVEELATIFHPPIGRVKATGLGQQESKRGAPPANLPIE